MLLTDQRTWGRLKHIALWIYSFRIQFISIKWISVFFLFYYRRWKQELKVVILLRQYKQRKLKPMKQKVNVKVQNNMKILKCEGGVYYFEFLLSRASLYSRIIYEGPNLWGISYVFGKSPKVHFSKEILSVLHLQCSYTNQLHKTWPKSRLSQLKDTSMCCFPPKLLFFISFMFYW